MSPETLKAIADRWTAHTTHTTDVPDLVWEIARQAEQIKRLRESLWNMLNGPIPAEADKARAVLKETAP